MQALYARLKSLRHKRSSGLESACIISVNTIEDTI